MQVMARKAETAIRIAQIQVQKTKNQRVFKRKHADFYMCFGYAYALPSQPSTVSIL